MRYIETYRFYEIVILKQQHMKSGSYALISDMFTFKNDNTLYISCCYAMDEVPA